MLEIFGRMYCIDILSTDAIEQVKSIERSIVMSLVLIELETYRLVTRLKSKFPLHLDQSYIFK